MDLRDRIDERLKTEELDDGDFERLRSRSPQAGVPEECDSAGFGNETGLAHPRRSDHDQVAQTVNLLQGPSTAHQDQILTAPAQLDRPGHQSCRLARQLEQASPPVPAYSTG